MAGTEDKKKRSRRSKVENVKEEPAVIEETPITEEVTLPVEAEVEEEEPIVEETDETDEQAKVKGQKKVIAYQKVRSDIDEVLNKVIADISEQKSKKNKEVTSILKNYEIILKRVKTTIKKLEPKEKKVSVKSQPSGFSKPLKITKEIADFAGWDLSDRKSRTDVTVKLCSYVSENSLQKPDHKRIIIPDDRLARLLRYDVSKDPPLTYSTMQKYIGHLFVNE